MSKKYLLIALLSLSRIVCFSQDSLEQRTYTFAAYNNYDLRNSSTNMISTYRVLSDAFDKGVSSKMKPKMRNVSKGIVNFSIAYLSMVWSHEFGHSFRTKQAGGHFNIHNAKLPIPYTTLDLPSDVNLVNEALSVTAGFEVNYLNIRSIQSLFIRQNGIANADLGFSFANRVMYPIYTSLIVPIDPKEKDVWINTAGDPVHYILPVFKNYSGGSIFLQDSIVNDELVSFYNQSALFATFYQFLDPQFYRTLGGAFGKSSKKRRPIFLIGDYHNGWTYSTLFNVSPLGYELYFQNYIHYKGYQFGLYTRYGRPFRNIGIGLSMNNIIDYEKIQSDILVELWNQDIFGQGVSVEIASNLKLTKHFGLVFNVGYKSEGYLLGKQINYNI